MDARSSGSQKGTHAKVEPHVPSVSSNVFSSTAQIGTVISAMRVLRQISCAAAVLYACSVSAIKSTEIAVRMTKAWMSDKYLYVGDRAVQFHGGMGFTWAFDCHLFYRRSNYLALALGGLNEWENKLVDALPSAVA